MNPLAGICVKIPIKQETYKHIHTQNNNAQTNSLFLVAAFVLAFFIKNSNYRRKKE